MEQPCRNGHHSERNKRGQCRECLREAMRRWRGRNPSTETDREKRREYVALNRARIRETQRAHRKKNQDRINARQRAWFAKNPGKAASYSKAWYEQNKERWVEPRKKWAKNNPDYLRRRGRAEQAKRRAAMPKWADRQAIQAIYDNCPPGYEVDHIIPINGRNVCGLHVPWNLQYLTPTENKAKGNRTHISTP